MHFATPKQIVAMVILSAAFLYGLDYWKNPQLWHKEEAASASKTAALTLWMAGACTADDVRQALSGLDGMDLARLSAKLPENAAPEDNTAVTIPVTDATKLDFTAVDRQLRQNGLVATRMELSGVPHFGLQAQFLRLPAASTDQQIEDRITFIKSQGMGEDLEWLDSVNMSSENKTLTAYARYVEPGKSVNVDELVSGLSGMGLAPSSLRVLVGDGMHQAHK